MVKINSLWLSVVLSTLAFTLLSVQFIAAWTRWQLPLWGVAVQLLLGGGVWLGFVYLTAGKPPAWAEPVASLSVLTAMVALGRLVGLAFREPGLLLPALLLAGPLDYWGVQQGFTAQMITERPRLVEKVSAHLPTFGGAAREAGLPALTIGPGDVATTALILDCAVKFGWNLWWNVGLLFGLTALGLGAGVLLGLPVPGLVFIGLAGILANWRHFRYSREEKKALLIAAALVGGLVGALVLAGRVRGL